jgi:hypothetical protein
MAMAMAAMVMVMVIVMMMTLMTMKRLIMTTSICFPEQMILMARMDVRWLMLCKLDLMRLT